MVESNRASSTSLFCTILPLLLLLATLTDANTKVKPGKGNRYLLKSALLRAASNPPAKPRLTVADLELLATLLKGEYDNNEQYTQDVASEAMGNDLHFFIRKLHIPVTIPSVDLAAGLGSVTKQIYLEQYMAGSPKPGRQRIYNLVLSTDGVIRMETLQAVNSSDYATWLGWRDDLDLFSKIQEGQLKFDPLCNFFWTKVEGEEKFTASAEGTNCRFTFLGQQVYLDSVVNQTRDLIVQDEAFRSVADNSTLSGATTPYLFNRKPNSDIDSIGLGDTRNGCHNSISLMCHVLQASKSELQILLYNIARVRQLQCYPDDRVSLFMENYC